MQRVLNGILLLLLLGAMTSCSNQNEAKPPVSVTTSTMTNEKYDDAAWHYSGDFPKELPQKAGATHIGMFVVWAILAGLHSEDFAQEVDLLRARKMTPGQFIIEQCDEVFHSSMLNDEGNRFAAVYFASRDGNFLKDYEKELEDGIPTLYHVKDTWENFDKIKPVFDRRLAEFRKTAKQD